MRDYHITENSQNDKTGDQSTKSILTFFLFDKFLIYQFEIIFETFVLRKKVKSMKIKIANKYLFMLIAMSFYY